MTDAARRALHFYLRILFGVLFIFASLSKVSDPGGFAEILKDYRLFPSGLALPLAHAVGWAEVALSLCLLFGIFRRASAVLLNAALFAFLLLTAVTLARGLEVSCGCFDLPGLGEAKIGWHKLLFNAGLCALALPLWLIREPDTGIRP